MKSKKNPVKYPWPTLKDRLDQPRVTRLEALRQLQLTMPLSESATKELIDGCLAHQHLYGAEPTLGQTGVGNLTQAGLEDLKKLKKKLNALGVDVPIVEPVRTAEGFLMLPAKLERNVIASAIRADRDKQ